MSIIEVKVTLVLANGIEIPVEDRMTPTEYSHVLDMRKQTVVRETTITHEKTVVVVHPISQAPSKKSRKNRGGRHGEKSVGAAQVAVPAAISTDAAVTAKTTEAAATKTTEAATKTTDAAAKTTDAAAKTTDAATVKPVAPPRSPSTTPDIDRITMSARSFSGSWADEADEEDRRKEEEALAAKKTYPSFLAAAKTGAETVPVVRGQVGAGVPAVEPDWEEVEERRKPRREMRERRPRGEWAGLPQVCSSDCGGVSANMRKAFGFDEQTKICNGLHGNHVGSKPTAIKICVWGPTSGSRACKEETCARNHLPEREWLIFRAGNPEWLSDPSNQRLLVSKGLKHLLQDSAVSAPAVVKLPIRIVSAKDAADAANAADISDEIAETDVDVGRDAGRDSTATPGAEETDSSGSGSE